MKLRVRVKGRTGPALSITLEEPATLGSLKHAVSTAAGITGAQQMLSLNSRDALCGDDTLLADFGIRRGDLVYCSDASAAAVPAASVAAPRAASTWVGDGRASVDSLGDARTSSGASLVAAPSSSATSVGLAPSATSDERRARMAEAAERRLASTAIADQSAPSAASDGPRPLAAADRPAPMEVDAVVAAQDSESEQGQLEEFRRALPALWTAAAAGNDVERVVLAVHGVLVAAGFTVADAEPGCPVPSTWRDCSIFRFEYRHFHDTQRRVLVKAVCLGTCISINANVAASTGVFRMALRPSELGVSAGGITNLYSLAQAVGAKLVRRLEFAVRGIVNGFRSLEDMYAELKLTILSMLPAVSVACMARVNRDFRRVCAEPRLWRCLYARDYDAAAAGTAEEDWRDRYKQKFVSRAMQREMDAAAQRFVPHVLPPRGFWGYGEWHAVPNRFPSIIGGDYDLHPLPPLGPTLPSPFGRGGGLPNLSGFPSRNPHHPGPPGRGGGWGPRIL